MPDCPDHCVEIGIDKVQHDPFLRDRRTRDHQQQARQDSQHPEQAVAKKSGRFDYAGRAGPVSKNARQNRSIR
jgi:hypothetical protein